MDSTSAYFAVPAFPRGPWLREDTIALPAAASAVSVARRHIRETLWEWKLDFLADDAELVLSELASNAIQATTHGIPNPGLPAQHARHPAQHASQPATPVAGEVDEVVGTILVRILGGPSRVLIGVWDPAMGPPVIGDTAPNADDENGRGLLLVSAFATRWHWYHPSRPHGGKVVWALLEGQDVDACICGFQADEPDGLSDHLEETFAAPDDRDTHGVAHAEAARDAACSTLPYRCLCGHIGGDAAGLDAHLLAVFTPADHIGQDGRTHAPAEHDPA